MGLEKESNVSEESPSSRYQVLQQLSGEAARVAGEAIQSYMSSPNRPPLGSGHRRSRSDVSSPNSNSIGFQKWKSQVRRALRWGNNLQEESKDYVFNPEILADQKRQWYQLQSRTSDQKRYKEPTSLFEHFVIAGLHPYTNLEVVESAYAKQKKWELHVENSVVIDFSAMKNPGTSLPKLEPQILFEYPPGKRLTMRSRDLAAFCFPEGVKARVLERSPSLSELNELVYGQEHKSRDDLSFIFSLKVADNATLYGVCLLVQEFVQRPPAILGALSPLSQSSGGYSRFLVSAPRCYCILTKVPFFELHYEMLNSIIAQERLNRITQFITEMSVDKCVAPVSTLKGPPNQNVGLFDGECCTDWMATAIPVDSAVVLAAAAAGITSNRELTSSSSMWETHSLESTSSEVIDHSQANESRENLHCPVDYTPQNCDNNLSPQSCATHRSHKLERLRSCDSLFSSVKSVESEDEDDRTDFSNYKDATEEMIMEWAKNNNPLLQIICSYHAMHLPQRGGELAFRPLEHLQAVVYRRSPVSALAQNENTLELKAQDSSAAEVHMKLAAAEEAAALSIWTTATICRVLSLENVLTLLTAVLLEKQVIVVCPNLGVLSAVVLSFIPIIRPFEWQSLFLPVLPGKMLDFLDAPVPFVVGMQKEPADLKMKTSNLVYVDVAKDQVKTCKLPALPRYKELCCELGPIHVKLSSGVSKAKHRPVYKCDELQTEAAGQFLSAMRCYLDSLCSDMRSHTITSVRSNNDRVSLLLKDSFIDSFPCKDQSFIKQFVDTQLFTVLSDSYLSTYENGYH